MTWLYLIGGMVVLALVGATVFAILERCTEDPIMRRRVNAGSGDYLAEHASLLDRILLSFGRTVEAVVGFFADIFQPGYRGSHDRASAHLTGRRAGQAQ